MTKTLYFRKYGLIAILAISLLSGCKNPERYMKKADQAIDRQDWTAAIDWYKKILEDFPDYSDKPKVYFALGILYSHFTSNGSMAVTMYQKGLKNCKDSTLYLEGLYGLGEICEEKFIASRYPDSAVSIYHTIIERAPKSQLGIKAQKRFQYLNETISFPVGKVIKCEQCGEVIKADNILRIKRKERVQYLKEYSINEQKKGLCLKCKYRKVLKDFNSIDAVREYIETKDYKFPSATDALFDSIISKRGTRFHKKIEKDIDSLLYLSKKYRETHSCSQEAENLLDKLSSQIKDAMELITSYAQDIYIVKYLGGGDVDRISYEIIVFDFPFPGSAYNGHKLLAEPNFIPGRRYTILAKYQGIIPYLSMYGDTIVVPTWEEIENYDKLVAKIRECKKMKREARVTLNKAAIHEKHLLVQYKKQIRKLLSDFKTLSL